MGQFVVLTGLDASGKDFVASSLHAVDPGSNIISTPPFPFSQYRHEVDNLTLASPAAHYLFYLASVIHASNQITEMLRRGNVYCIRYLIDTVAYHRALGLPVELEYETPIYKIRRPDMTFLLTVDDEQIRQNRLKLRGEKTAGDLLVDQEQIRNAIIKEYASFSDQFIIINNSSRDIKEIIDEIRSHLFPGGDRG